MIIYLTTVLVFFSPECEKCFACRELDKINNRAFLPFGSVCGMLCYGCAVEGKHLLKFTLWYILVSTRTNTQFYLLGF